jgi:hypothetical protein
VTIHHERTFSSVAIRVDVELPDPCHEVASWGEPERTGLRFRAESSFVVAQRVVCPMVLVNLSHTYELGDLSPGDYEFVFSASGTVLKTYPFTVPDSAPYVPAPDAVRLSHRLEGARHLVEAQVDLPSSCHEVWAWGTPSRSGPVIEAEAQFRQVSGVCLPAVFTASHTFDLGSLPPGDCEFRLLAGSVVVQRLRFSTPEVEITGIQMYPGLSITGIVGQTYVVAFTTAIADPQSWTPLATNTLTGPEWFFVDRDAPRDTHRFYRADPW